jgi:hypothetical protein
MVDSKSKTPRFSALRVGDERLALLPERDKHEIEWHLEKKTQEGGGTAEKPLSKI